MKIKIHLDKNSLQNVTTHSTLATWMVHFVAIKTVTQFATMLTLKPGGHTRRQVP